jgi:hypothetical protein
VVCKELPKIQEDVTRKKEVKEEEAGSGTGSGEDYQICIPLG